MPYQTGFPVANKLLNKYEQDRNQRLHRQKVHQSRHTISNDKPKKYPHIILPLKRMQIEEEQQAEVDHENTLLLQKMTKIMKTPNPAFWNDYNSRSLNMPARKKHLRDIQMENIGIARRLEKTKPVINSDALEEDYQYKRYIQSLWNDSSKEFDNIIPKHKKFRQLRRLKEEVGQTDRSDNDKTDDDSTRDTERLPPIPNKQSDPKQAIRYNAGAESYRTTKSDSSTRNDRRSEDDLQSNAGSQINNSQLDTDTKALFKVGKQLAQPDDVFIKHLVRRSHKHRMQIKKRFRELYDLDLIAELKSGLGNDWNLLIDALLKERNNSGAKKIHDALEEGDYPTAVEVLFTSKSNELHELRESYRKEYAVSLESDIHDKTEDPERALLMTLQAGGRDESVKIDEKLTGIDANDLYESGDGRWSSDTGKFMKMLKARNNKHIKVVLNLYKALGGGTDAMEDIKRECSKTYADTLITLINCLRGSENHYADILFKTMSATDPAFINLLVLRSETDIPAVRKAYKKKYDAELIDDIRHKCAHRTTTVLMEIANRTPPNYPKGRTQQRKFGSVTVITQTPRQTVKRQERVREIETKSKSNPLAQPSMRIAADTAALRKEEEKEKQEERDKKKEQERQKKNISGTVKPSNNFNPISDCERIHEAMSSFNTDERELIDILPNRSNGQRQILKDKYKKKYNKDLTEELKSNTSGDLEEIVLGLMMTPTEYDAHSLHEALDGFGTSESTLIGILCTRDAVEMKDIKEQYRKAYKKELVQDLQSETNDLTDLLVALSNGSREQGKVVNMQEAQKDAKRLYKNGELAVDTKDTVFINLLVKKNHAQVKATFQEYEKLAGHDMNQGIVNAMLGDSEEGYLSVAKAAEDPTQYFAERLNMCFSGLGTNDNKLIRIVVSRSELDLRDIKAHYQQLYGKSLSRMVKDECNGDYKEMLLAILGDL